MTNATHIHYQLTTIQLAIEEHLANRFRRSRQGIAPSDYTVSKHDDHVRLEFSENEPDCHTVLILKPLFPGSYSQNEVVAEYQSRTGMENSKDTALLYAGNSDEKIVDDLYEPGVIEPALHYARFNSLPDSLDRIYHAENKPISVIVEGKDISELECKRLISLKLKRMLLSHPSCKDIVFIQVRLSQNSGAYNSRKKYFSYENDEDIVLPNGISAHRTVITKAEQLFTLLARSQCTLVPSLSHAMDATSAGCPSQLYATDQLAIEFSDSIETINAKNGRALSQLQHRAIRHYQIRRYKVQTLIQYKSELHKIIDRQCVAGREVAKSRQMEQHHHPLKHVIIPLNSLRTNDVKERLTQTRSKFRKFRHSPKQFLQDSSDPRLRKLGNLRSS